MKPIGDEGSDALVRLLSLKRHEVPPPGYLEGFAGSVTARIAAAGLATRRPWWTVLSDVLLGRPVFAGVGGLVGGMLFVGMLSPGDASVGDAMFAESGWGQTSIAATLPVGSGQRVLASLPDHVVIVSPAGSSSVAPLVERSSPFSRAASGMVGAQTVSYTTLH